uniref:Uncharacterized protein n=1 Tax=Arundo donax TaxID=35708 RepID=A0A0A9H2Z0_ARUDO
MNLIQSFLFDILLRSESSFFISFTSSI